MQIRILLIGSYNGQDSVGDECLLESVVAQFHRVFDEPRIFLHAHSTTTYLASLRQEYKIETNRGLQTFYWIWRNKWRHTRLPIWFYSIIAACLFPAYVFYGLIRTGHGVGTAIRQIIQTDIIYVFGGTQFSTQWFWLNAPYYFMTAVIGRLFGALVYFGPQQYGPLNRVQATLLRVFIRYCVSDFRARHNHCLNELGMRGEENETKVVHDEVYSNVALYPIKYRRDKKSFKKDHILLNIRQTNFWDDAVITENKLQYLASILERLYNIYAMDFVFFSMSGASFCHDDAIFERISAKMPRSPIRRFGRVSSGIQLIEMAESAMFCISMSFHGCVLSSIAGIPSIPVTDGEYYNYKYRDFKKYGDGTEIPIIDLMSDDIDDIVKRISEYVEKYSIIEYSESRRKAGDEMFKYYHNIKNDVLSRRN